MHDRVRAELVRELPGQGASHERVLFFKRMVERQSGAPRAALVLAVHAAYWDAFLERMEPAASAHEVLTELAASAPLALVSNHTTTAQLRKIARLELEPYLTAIVTSEEVGVEKPDARIFRAALDALGVDAPRAVMIGDDAAVDIAGARAVGLRTVLTTEFGAATAPADVVVSSLAEVPAAVRQLARA